VLHGNHGSLFPAGIGVAGSVFAIARCPATAHRTAPDTS
jgi:hypothetical protein